MKLIKICKIVTIIVGSFFVGYIVALNYAHYNSFFEIKLIDILIVLIPSLVAIIVIYIASSIGKVDNENFKILELKVVSIDKFENMIYASRDLCRKHCATKQNFSQEIRDSMNYILNSLITITESVSNKPEKNSLSNILRVHYELVNIFRGFIINKEGDQEKLTSLLNDISQKFLIYKINLYSNKDFKHSRSMAYYVIENYLSSKNS